MTSSFRHSYVFDDMDSDDNNSPSEWLRRGSDRLLVRSSSTSSPRTASPVREKFMASSSGSGRDRAATPTALLQQTPQNLEISDEDEETYPESFKFVDVLHLPNLLQGLKNLYEQETLTDVTLCVDEEEFGCHRLILASCSPYFFAMWTNDLVEKKMDKVKINGVETEAMRLVLDYIYTSEVDITETNVSGLLVASNMFQIFTLRDACASYMEKHVTLHNCINIYFFASAHECGKLKDLAKKLIYDKFTEVCKEEEFLNLSKERLVDLISEDGINVEKEEIVYEAVISWLEKDLNTRKKDVVDVMCKVRFALISPYYIHDCLERDRNRFDSEEFQKLLEDALQYHLLTDRRRAIALVQSMNENTRKGMPWRDTVVYFTKMDTSSTAASMESLISEDHFFKIKPLPDAISDERPECVVTGNNRIYVAGRQMQEYGSSARRMFSSSSSRTSIGRAGVFYEYDHFDKKWICRNPMSVTRTNFRMTVLDGLVYAVGGVHQDLGIVDTVEFYNPETNAWKSTNPMLQAVRGHCVAALDGLLYVMGGESQQTVLDVVQCYNPRSQAWNLVSSMVLPRALAGVTVYKNQIYVMGGTVSSGSQEKYQENLLNSIEIYNPYKNEWKFGPELPEARCNYQIILYGAHLYVLNGESTRDDDALLDASSGHNAVWRLDTEENQWVKATGWPNIFAPPLYTVVARLLKD